MTTNKTGDFGTSHLRETKFLCMTSNLHKEYRDTVYVYGKYRHIVYIEKKDKAIGRKDDGPTFRFYNKISKDGSFFTVLEERNTEHDVARTSVLIVPKATSSYHSHTRLVSIRRRLHVTRNIVGSRRCQNIYHH